MMQFGPGFEPVTSLNEHVGMYSLRRAVHLFFITFMLIEAVYTRIICHPKL